MGIQRPCATEHKAAFLCNVSEDGGIILEIISKIWNFFASQGSLIRLYNGEGLRNVY